METRNFHAGTVYVRCRFDEPFGTLRNTFETYLVKSILNILTQ